MRTAKEIAADLALAKTNENNSKHKRIELEEELLAQFDLGGKERKTVKFENGLTATMETGYSYKLLTGYPESMPVKVKVELDTSKYEKLREDHPELSKFVEVKPKKPSVTLKVG